MAERVDAAPVPKYQVETKESLAAARSCCDSYVFLKLLDSLFSTPGICDLS